MTRPTLTRLNRKYIEIPTGRPIPVRDFEAEEKRDKALLENETATGPVNREPIYKVGEEKILIKRDKILPPTPREKVTFLWNGIEITTLVAPGMTINKHRLWKKEMKRREMEEKRGR